MAADYIERIEALAGAFRPHERNLTLYFADLETAPPAGNLNRVFGPPVGVTADDWPRYAQLGELLHEANCLQQWDPCDERMEHVFTIDLAGVDLLGAPRGARAMMLFISNASYHHATAVRSRETAVVFLGPEEVERGLFRGPLPRRSVHRWSRRFSLTRLDVPGDVFDCARNDGRADPELLPLYEAICDAPARLGGRPVWLDPTDAATSDPAAPLPPTGLRAPSSFVMQFGARFAEVNLGHDGVMYVHGRGAYCQSR
jgi:hypothetical protein